MSTRLLRFFGYHSLKALFRWDVKHVEMHLSAGRRSKGAFRALHGPIASEGYVALWAFQMCRAVHVRQNRRRTIRPMIDAPHLGQAMKLEVRGTRKMFAPSTRPGLSARARHQYMVRYIVDHKYNPDNLSAIDGLEKSRTEGRSYLRGA